MTFRGPPRAVSPSASGPVRTNPPPPLASAPSSLKIQHIFAIVPVELGVPSRPAEFGSACSLTPLAFRLRTERSRSVLPRRLSAAITQRLH